MIMQSNMKLGYRIRLMLYDHMPVFLSLFALAMLMGGMALYRFVSTTAAAQASSAMVVVTAVPIPTLSTDQASDPRQHLPGAVVARHDYREPGSATALEAGRPYTPLAYAIDESGTVWLLLNVDTAAPVWVPQSAAPGIVLSALPEGNLTVQTTAVPAPAVVPAAASAQPAPCTPETAIYRAGWRVEMDRAPVGEVAGYSCTSQAEAEQQARIAEQELRATVTSR